MDTLNAITGEYKKQFIESSFEKRIRNDYFLAKRGGIL